MAFVGLQQHDNAWLHVVLDLCAGKLGIAAKTAPPDPSAERPTAVLIAYTHDWEDRDDCLRVALALRAAGLKQTLTYKTDACVRVRMRSSSKDVPH